MNSVLAVCFPATDVDFGERVRGFVADDQWDLRSPEGIALMQAVLRQGYPMATILPKARALRGGWYPTLVLDVYRDGKLATRRDRTTRQSRSKVGQSLPIAETAVLPVTATG